jgi:DNA-binding NarL/FixJ family response regulator
LLKEHSDIEVVAEATNGRETMEFCRRFRPDLAVVEVGMPEVNSLETIRAIKGEWPSTAVLVLSAHENPDLLAEALKAGASGYILKTATPQEIIDAIRRTMEGAPTLDAGLTTETLLRVIARQEKEDPSPLAPKALRGGEHASAPVPASLTQREVEVLRLVARGHTNLQIAHSLFVSVSTVKKHVRHIFSKLEVSDRTQAAVRANELGLLADREVEERQPLEGARPDIARRPRRERPSK